MARPQEYSRDKVLQAATDLFWKKGYHGTSLSELVSTTRLNKQSMYKEFGNKAGLFNACLEYYRSTMGKLVTDILRKEPLSIENIKELFRRQLEYAASTDFKGCIFINSANEKELLDNTAREQVDLFFKRLEQLFFNCLKTDFPPQTARTKALYCVTIFAGIMSAGKAGQNQFNDNNYFDLILSVIDK